MTTIGHTYCALVTGALQCGFTVEAVSLKTVTLHFSHWAYSHRIRFALRSDGLWHRTAPMPIIT